MICELIDVQVAVVAGDRILGGFGFTEHRLGVIERLQPRASPDVFDLALGVGWKRP